VSSSEHLSAVTNGLDALLAACTKDGTSVVYLATRADDHGPPVLEGNPCGLIRLAMLLVDLAQRYPGAHVHLDHASELDVCEQELIIQYGDPGWPQPGFTHSD
jgi:hypothetical protein